MTLNAIGRYRDESNFVDSLNVRGSETIVVKLPSLPLVSPAMADRILALIGSYVPSHSGPHEQGVAAARLGWLPVSWQMGGVLVLSPDGRVGILSDGPPYSIEREADQVWALIARVHAVRNYPELAAIVPVKNRQSIRCGECKGKGRISIGQASLDCGKCAALGWGIAA